MNPGENELRELLSELGQLPKGNVTYRVIRGKKRMYLQWYEDHKKISKYVKASDEAQILLLISRRGEINARIKELVEHADTYSLMEDTPVYGTGIIKGAPVSDGFATGVILGQQLSNMFDAVKRYDERDGVAAIRTYLDLAPDGRVCLVYGLRRTGKTTMALQALSHFHDSVSAYIKIKPSDTMDDLNRDLKKLFDNDIRLVFVDEVTLMSDFIDSASLLSDVYSMSGMKIILSGTDSLGFALSANEELYDRAYMVHTTFIPFREYARLLDIHEVDEYIRYGGTLSPAGRLPGGEDISEGSGSFADEASTERYIDTAIARNIQHSLLHYRDGGHFRHLQELFEAGELTGAINRIIEDMNHRFLISVLTRRFVSHDLGSARQITRKRSALTGEKDALSEIDVEKITDRLRALLEIKEKDNMSVGITGDHVKEIRDYLRILDLIVDCPSETIDSENGVEHILFSQPGMRYCQAQALVYALRQDEVFNKTSAKEKRKACELILEEVKGRMLEEIVLLETCKSLSKGKRAFKLLFPVGEIDMVICDEDATCCHIYEIKHSAVISPEQYRYLTDEKMREQIEFKYGEILSTNVIYRGESTETGGISYINVADYLEGLGRK
ncbi:MAG: AAA family ATPase [Butyrivibrio sp.]|nr:AAA family ATPase [Butyrivibrio sp.]